MEIEQLLRLLQQAEDFTIQEKHNPLANFDWEQLPNYANKYIAKDKNGRIYSYAQKPILRHDCWGEWGEVDYRGSGEVLC